MPAEPLIKRAFSFTNGQNLYQTVRESFGYAYPGKGWELIRIHYHTGVPDRWND